MHTYPREDFQREASILKSLFDEDVYNLLSLLDVMVAGGTLTSLFSNRDVNDLDLYFRSWDDMEVFISYMHDRDLRAGKHDLTNNTNGWNETKRNYRRFKKLDGFSLENIQAKVMVTPDPDAAHRRPMTSDQLQEMTRALENRSAMEKLRELLSEAEADDFPQVKTASFISNVGMTDKSVMYTNQRAPVMQVIAFNVFDSPQAIFDKFDFTINMGAFCFKTGEWFFDKGFLKHIAQKVLVVNPNTDYPIISLLRAGKYEARGYTISRRETMKLALSASRLEMRSWEDAKAHLSGMYGTNVETLFKEDKDFSFELLFDKLDNAGDKTITQIATDKEKADREKVNHITLKKMEYFQVINLLRKNTGRPYFKKIWGVCKSKHFYLLEPENSSQVIHTGMDNKHPSWSKLELYCDKDDALSTYNHNEKEGRVLLEVDILDVKRLRSSGCDQVTVLMQKGEGEEKDHPVCAVVTKYVSSNGDFS